MNNNMQNKASQFFLQVMLICLALGGVVGGLGYLLGFSSDACIIAGMGIGLVLFAIATTAINNDPKTSAAVDSYLKGKQ